MNAAFFIFFEKYSFPNERSLGTLEVKVDSIRSATDVSALKKASATERGGHPTTFLNSNIMTIIKD